ncbi:MAG: hypothetical protein AAFY11_07350, partial [Cyanobacteria bacterium J06641_5]
DSLQETVATMSETVDFGVIDFLNMVYEGHPEYTIIAVKAPLEDAIAAFMAASQQRQTRQRSNSHTVELQDLAGANVRFERLEAIPIQETQPEEEVAAAIAAISTYGCDWTILLRSIFYAHDEIFDVPIEARAISAKLQTRTVTLIEEDTSGAIAYELFEDGDRLEYFSEAGEEDFDFDSKLRSKPEISFEDDWSDADDEAEYEDCSEEPRVQFVDAFFRDLGVYLPACYLTGDAQQPALAVDMASLEAIERADWLSVTIEREESASLD